MLAPDAISDLVLWLDARHIEGLDDSDPVAVWEDQSSAGNDAVQATSGNRPTWREAVTPAGGPAVRFTAASQHHLTTALVPDLQSGTTVIFSNAATVHQGHRVSAHGAGSTRWIDAYWGSGNHVAYTGPGTQRTLGPYVLDHWYRTVLRADGNNKDGWIDGAQTITWSDSSSGTSSAVTIGRYSGGAFDPFNGQLALVLHYDRALSDGELEGLDAWIVAEFGREPEPLDVPPPHDSDLVLWLDGRDVPTAIGPGGRVNTWPDQSGEGNDAAQSSATNRPRWLPSRTPNGSPAIQFVSASRLSLPVPSLGVDLQAATSVLYTRAATTHQGQVFSGHAGGNTLWAQAYWGSGNHVAYTGATTQRVIASYAAEVWYRTVLRADGNDKDGWVDGAQESTWTDSNSGGPSSMVVGRYGGGNSDFFNGDVAVVLHYDRALTDGELDDVDAWVVAQFVTAGTPVTAQPPAAAVTWTAPAPTVIAGTSVTVDAPSAHVAWTAPTPTVRAFKAATVAPGPATVTWTAPVPTVITSVPVQANPPPALIDWSCPTPTVIAGRSATTTPTPAAVAWHTPTPTIHAHRRATVRPPAAYCTWHTPVPVVVPIPPRPHPIRIGGRLGPTRITTTTRRRLPGRL